MEYILKLLTQSYIIIIELSALLRKAFYIQNSNVQQGFD